MLMESESEFLVIDFFDFCQPVACYKDTTFSTYDYCFYRTSAFRNESKAYSSVNFFDVPCYLWYGYVDLYFHKMTQKFGERSIILNKLSCYNGYIDRKGHLRPTPENLLNFGNAKFNEKLDDLENYVIHKFNPYVIDITKYFIPDENNNPDVTPIHYESGYHEAAWFLTSNIVMNKPTQRLYDNLPPKVIASLLHRNVNDNDFLEIYNSRSKPYVCHDLLDDIFINSDTLDIMANRHWLGKLFEEFHQRIPSISDYHDKDALANYITAVDNFKTCNEYQERIVKLLREKKEYLLLSHNELINQFNAAVEASDLKWITILNCLGILYAEDTTIMNMLLNYYTATNDSANIAKMKQRLSESG